MALFSSGKNRRFFRLDGKNKTELPILSADMKTTPDLSAMIEDAKQENDRYMRPVVKGIKDGTATVSGLFPQVSVQAQSQQWSNPDSKPIDDLEKMRKAFGGIGVTAKEARENLKRITAYMSDITHWEEESETPMSDQKCPHGMSSPKFCPDCTMRARRDKRQNQNRARRNLPPEVDYSPLAERQWKPGERWLPPRDQLANVDLTIQRDMQEVTQFNEGVRYVPGLVDTKLKVTMKSMGWREWLHYVNVHPSSADYIGTFNTGFIELVFVSLDKKVYDQVAIDIQEDIRDKAPWTQREPKRRVPQWRG